MDTPAYNPNGFTVNPQPQGGSGVFGAVPGAVDLPNPYVDLTNRIPNLGAQDNAASNDILKNLEGKLSPDTLNLIQRHGAARGFASGMPGSDFAGNALLADVAHASQGQQAKGVGQYNEIIPMIGKTQTTAPDFQSELAMLNAINAAAPNPGQAGMLNLLGSLGGLGAGYLASRGGGGGGFNYGGMGVNAGQAPLASDGTGSFQMQPDGFNYGSEVAPINDPNLG